MFISLKTFILNVYSLFAQWQLGADRATYSLNKPRRTLQAHTQREQKEVHPILAYNPPHPLRINTTYEG